MGLFLIILSFCSKIQCKIRRRSVLPTCWPHSVKSTLPVRTVRFWFSYVLFFLLFFSYFPTGQKEELCLKWSQIPILFSLRHRNERRIYFIIVTLQYNSRKFLWTRKGEKRAHSDIWRYKPHPLPTGSQDRSGHEGQTLTAHWGWTGPKPYTPGMWGPESPSLPGRWSNYVCLGLWLEVTSRSWEKSYHLLKMRLSLCRVCGPAPSTLGKALTWASVLRRAEEERSPAASDPASVTLWGQEEIQHHERQAPDSTKGEWTVREITKQSEDKVLEFM